MQMKNSGMIRTVLLLYLIMFSTSIIFPLSETGYYSMKFLLDKPNMTMVWFSTLMVGMLMVKYYLGSEKLTKPMESFIFLFWFLTVLLFSCGDMFLFYFFFEFSVIPLMFMVSAIGYSLERIKSMVYMYMYTVVFSMPALFLLIVGNFSSAKLLSFTSMIFAGAEEGNMLSMAMVMGIFLMFLMKMPIWGFHFWLPKAHVEASVQGSMLLASLVLKMGVFGAWKVASSLLYLGISSWVTPVLVVATMGGILMSLLCIRQTDNKISVALSSIVHMGPCLILVMSGNTMSIESLFLIMLSHGFISPAMFMFIYDIYTSTKSRSLVLSMGSLKNIWIAQTTWFLICICNMGMPLTMNFWGEMCFFQICINISSLLCGLLLVTILTNGLYNIFLFNFLNMTGPKASVSEVATEYGTIKLALAMLMVVLMFLFVDLEL